MDSYYNMIKKVTNIICDNQKENNNYILVGDNSSGKSEILQSVIEREKDGAIYFIDSVNRTFKVNDVELVGKSYENMSFDLRPILEMRLDPLNFNLQDTFGVLSCIERLYAKYEQKLIRMCKEFLGKDIHIEKEVIEEVGLTENVVIVNGERVKLSSGYQAILRVFCEIVFFCDVMQVNNWERGLVVIDEIDEYLSPRYSAEILNYLQNQFPDMNFLVTTHSLDLVKSTKNMNLIVIGESGYEVYTGQQLEDSMLAEDVFTNLFFEERKIHKSEDDSIDKELRRLLNIKIAKIWNEEYQKEFDDLPFDTMTPHQKIIYKQIEGW